MSSPATSLGNQPGPASILSPGLAPEDAPAHAGPKAPRISLPLITPVICVLCAVLGILAAAGKDNGQASALLSLSFVCGLIAAVTTLFRRIELRLIDIEHVLRAQRPTITLP